MDYKDFYKEYEAAALKGEAGNAEEIAALPGKYLPILGAQFFAYCNTAKIDYAVAKAKRIYKESGVLDSATTFRILTRDLDSATRAVGYLELVRLGLLSISAMRDTIGEAYVSSNLPPEEIFIGVFDSLQRRGGVILPNEKDKAAYDALGDTVVVYRGQSYKDYLSQNFGASWTLSEDTARFFAYTYIGTPKGENIVLRATISKADILAVFMERGEKEIIVAGRCLRDIEIIDKRII